MDTLDAYEELVKLKDNPAAFAQRQKEIITEAIYECPENLHHKLECNQWKLEQELKHYKDPTARMNKMVEIFWAGVNDFVDTNNSPPSIPHKEEDDNIIPFKKK